MSDKDKLVLAVYNDSLSPAMKVLGEVVGDLAKTAKLIALPISYTARLSEKMDKVLNKINDIPEENKISIEPQISAPLLNFMPLINDSEGDDLWNLFENIFINSADSERVKYVHPAFCHLITQLSKDEAYILKKLNAAPFIVKDELAFNNVTKKFEGREYIKCEIPFDENITMEVFNIYFQHLHSLFLVEWPVFEDTPKFVNNVQVASIRDSVIRLTEFGQLFMNACTRN